MKPKFVRVVGAAIARLISLRAIMANLRAGTFVGTMVGYLGRYGVKTLEEGLAAGIPFEYMGVMR